MVVCATTAKRSGSFEGGECGSSTCFTCISNNDELQIMSLNSFGSLSKTTIVAREKEEWLPKLFFISLYWRYTDRTALLTAATTAIDANITEKKN